MSIKIFVKYFGANGSSRELREMAYWRATAVCLVINDFEAEHPIGGNVVSIDPDRSAGLLRSISTKLRGYGIVRGSSWWQRGRGQWKRLDSKVRFDGWDRGHKEWMIVLLEHDPAPSFEVRRRDYGLEE